MDFENSYVLPDDLLESFDVELQTFYQDAIRKEIDLSKPGNVSEIKRALKKVVDAYRKETVDACSSSINFDTPAKRSAYVFKHSSCFTSAVAKHWLQLLKASPSVLQLFLSKRTLNFCCLGGGPATDVVGFTKILNAALEKFWVKDDCSFELHITVVDLSKNWKVTAKNVLQTLQEASNFFDSRKIIITFRFLKADLTQTWNKNVKEVIESADVVTMIYFLSAVNGSKVKDKSSLMLKEIMKHLKQGALLFFLDSSKELHYKGLSAVAQTYSDLIQIYGPQIQEFHTLSMKSLKKFLEIYSPYFQMYLCLSHCFVSCSAWQRGGELKMMEKIRSPDQFYNTKRMYTFREKVNKLLLAEFDLLYYFYLEEYEDKETTTELSESDWICAKPFYPTKSKRKRIFSD